MVLYGIRCFRQQTFRLFPFAKRRSYVLVVFGRFKLHFVILKTSRSERETENEEPQISPFNPSDGHLFCNGCVFADQTMRFCKAKQPPLQREKSSFATQNRLYWGGK